MEIKIDKQRAADIKKFAQKAGKYQVHELLTKHLNKIYQKTELQE